MPAQMRPVRIALGGFLTLAAGMGIGRFVYTPLLPMMAADLGLSPTEAGLIASANFAGYLAGALIASLPFLPGGRKFWLIAALCASGLTTAAMGLFDGITAQAGLRAAGGVASAFALVYGSALVTGHIGAAGRAGLVALHFAGVGAGIALSALAVGAASEFGAGWRTLWLVGGAATIAAMVAVIFMVPAGAPAGGEARGEKRPGLWRLVAAYGCLGFGYVITATFIVAIVREGGGTAWAEAGVWCLVGLAGMPSVWLWNRAVPRFGAIPVYQVALLIEAAGVAVCVIWPGTIGLAIGAVALGGTFMALTAMGFAIARTMSGGDQRAILGVMTAAFGTGQMLGPAVAGWLRDATGSYLAPSLAASAVLVAGAVLIVPLRRART